MAFKKFKIQKKKETKFLKDLPKIKDIKVPQTHTNKFIIDSIGILLRTKQNTGLRKILDLSSHILSRNIYILTSKVLEVCLEDNFSNELCFKVLKKLLTNNNKIYIYNLLFKYLEVSILSNREYGKYMKMCIEHCNEMVYKNKTRICEILENREDIKKITSINIKKKQCTFKDTVTYFNGEFIY
ncbi:uncharacterized protein VNE69_04207 [Vairimorpha necatrix]|uniref:Uncharacterized protein n=1 Tax=Vairimorpha necatrix TaxID=6039 RepID=A0AAX4JBQ8_9MICR